MRLANLLTSFLIPIISTQKVYFIRHGEKPADDSPGLIKEGWQRAECLRTIFGNSSSYNIGKIIAQTPKPGGRRARPMLTVQPLAADLGLEVDVSCGREDFNCVKDTVHNQHDTKNILICWEHHRLREIVKALGDHSPPKYHGHSYDVIWTYEPPYHSISAKTLQKCPGLDTPTAIEPLPPRDP